MITENSTEYAHQRSESSTLHSEIEYKLVLPLEVWLTSRKKWILNQNNYRIAHYQTLAKAKRKYTELVLGALVDSNLRNLRINYPVNLTYNYYPKTLRGIDTANPCSIIDKFTCDALTLYNIWPDDNFKWVRSVEYLYVKKDKHNPRCELIIGRC